MTFMLCIMLGAIFVGCQSGNHAQNDPLDKTEIHFIDSELDLSAYESEMESLRVQVDHLIEQNEHLIHVITQLTKDLSEEEMLEFSQSQFQYDLRVNGQTVPKDGKLEISAGEVEILLSEKSLGHDFLPPDWLEKGKISGDDYIDHIVDFDPTNWTLTGADGTVHTSRGYQISHIKEGEQITFSITDELKHRLNLDTTMITIEVH